MAKTGKKRKAAAGDVATNRQASFRFDLLDRLECGVVLQGTEVKALRDGTAQIKDGFASIRDGEMWLYNVHIPPYAPASRANHEPERPRKLLAHKREIDRLVGKTQERGLTLVPTRLYFKDGYASVRDSEVWLHNVHIPPYGPAARENHEPERPRKLLMHHREIERLIGKTREKGLTLVPTRLYFSG
ncbi:MAG: SsrA-binding protein, partial [bacterium]